MSDVAFKPLIVLNEEQETVTIQLDTITFGLLKEYAEQKAGQDAEAWRYRVARAVADALDADLSEHMR